MRRRFHHTNTPQRSEVPVPPEDRFLRRLLVSSAVVLTGFVAVVAGRASWSGISTAFDSWHAPAMVDGFVLAVTLLRLGMLTHGWRLPASSLATAGGLAATAYFNYVEAERVQRGDAFRIEAVAAPGIYFVLAEYLALLIKLRLRLRVQQQARISPAVWAASPIASTRALLYMARTGQRDVVAARIAIARAQRAASELKIICPGSWMSRSGAGPRRARRAAVRSIRDGVLTARQIVELLPSDSQSLEPLELLRLVNRAAVVEPDAPAPQPPASPPLPPLPPPPAPPPGGQAHPGQPSVKSRVFELARQASLSDPLHPVNSDDPRLRNGAVRDLLVQLGEKVSPQSARKYGKEWAALRKSSQQGP